MVGPPQGTFPLHEENVRSATVRPADGRPAVFLAAPKVLAPMD